MDDFADKLRSQEIYQSQRFLPGAWVILRVDGRGFSGLTEAHYTKPFDERFRDHMHAAATALMEDMQGALAYVQSDEISVLLPPDWDLFDRRQEKAVSLAAAIAAAHFSLAAGRAVQFDGRAWVGCRADDVADYFCWRQADATRCALSTTAYWVLRNEGQTVRQATRALEGATISQKNELLFERGVNFNELPVWQRRGAVIVWETYEKEGFNPKTNETVTTSRRRLATDWDIPMKDAFGEYIRARLSA
jgi:tRNA(His) 5'-end guanylyltransferase